MCRATNNISCSYVHFYLGPTYWLIAIEIHLWFLSDFRTSLGHVASILHTPPNCGGALSLRTMFEFLLSYLGNPFIVWKAMPGKQPSLAWFVSQLNLSKSSGGLEVSKACSSWVFCTARHCYRSRAQRPKNFANSSCAWTHWKNTASCWLWRAGQVPYSHTAQAKLENAGSLSIKHSLEWK